MVVGRLSMLAVAVAACTRDPSEWPPKEVAGLEASCAKTFGSARICPCYAQKTVQRVSFADAKELIASPDDTKGNEQIFMTLEAITLDCAKGLGPAPWPKSMRANFIEGCRGGKGADNDTCECLADVLQRHVSPELFMASSFGIRAGKPMAADIAELFKTDEAGGCFSFSPDGGWPETARDKTIAECESNPDIPHAMCRCFVDEMMREMSWAETARLGVGKDDGGVQAKVTRLAPTWLRRCAAAPAKTAKSKWKVKRR